MKCLPACVVACGKWLCCTRSPAAMLNACLFASFEYALTGRDFELVVIGFTTGGWPCSDCGRVRAY
eukprot:2836937-Amphidinium_carterae.1